MRFYVKKSAEWKFLLNLQPDIIASVKIIVKIIRRTITKKKRAA